MRLPRFRVPKGALWAGLAVLAAAVLVAQQTFVQRAPEQVASVPAARADTPAAELPPDSTAAAQAIHDTCGGKPPEEKKACYEEALLRMLSAAGVRTAMGTLGRLGALDREVESDGHVYSHAIGIRAYALDPDVARTFASCTEAYQSGCYHGVIQAYFQGVRRVTATEANALCEAYRGERGDMWLLFQCVHGMGHGLTMLRAHDLPRALRDCDLLTSDWDRDACYGGAIMENIVNATDPHHPASHLGGSGAQPQVGHAEHASGQAAEAGDGHAHDAAAEPVQAGEGHVHRASAGGPAPSGAAAPRFKPLDPADPHYPCSVLEEKYLPACYQMQTSVMLHFNGGDFADAARTCDGAPAAVRTHCYQSLGRDVSAYTLQDPVEGIRLCSVGDPAYQPWCYVGLAKNYVDLTARTESAFALCRQVPGTANRLKCHEAVGEEIGILEPGAAERAAMCEESEAGYVDACRYGARLTDQRPPGLPG